MPNLIIGSRGSRLALWQANWIKSELERLHEGLEVEIEIIKTTGDLLTEASLSRMPGKGVFTKEIEEALYDQRIDLAVHSLKDLPTILPEGLHLSAVTKREDPRDALIVNRRLATRVNSLLSLPVQPIIGTSSPRRASQLRLLRPDAQILELRGNVETRLRKLEEENFDAIILAAAGLNRLGYSSQISHLIPPHHLLPAVGQGALGIETRVEDERVNYLVEALNHWPTRNAVEAERAVLRGLGGGCAVPIAAYGEVDSEEGTLKLEGLVCDVAGTRIVRHAVSGTQYKCEELGSLLARHLIAAGAHQLLAENPEPEVEEISIPSPNPFIEINTTATSMGTAPRMIESNEDDSIQNKISTAPVTTVMVAEPPPTIVTETESPKATNGFHYEPAHKNGNGNGNGHSSGKVELPLSGKRILVTRAKSQADSLVFSLEKNGADVVLCPTIEIRPPDNWKALDKKIENLRNYDWLVFTSANGVLYFLQRFDMLGHGRAELAALKICAVGKKTAEKLSEERLQVDLLPAKFTAEGLVSAFIKKFGVGQRLRGTRMLLPAAKATRDVIRPTLEKLGVEVDVVEAYQNTLPEFSVCEVQELITKDQIDYAIFTSPSTLTNLSLLLDSENLAAFLRKTKIACIGPVTAQAAQRCGLPVHLQPQEHTAPAIVDEIVNDCRVTA
jgi:hydroxymethylbilane synthase